jgi:excinuclease UvrABC ATPase subunit
MQELVERGDTVLVIEHHRTILAADWVIDLGPEAAGRRQHRGEAPEDIMRERSSHTGRMLKRESSRTRSQQPR